jgi:chemotaxis protein MotB
MARRRRHEEHENHEAWAIPYGDLVTLLLAFFVVMYSISSVNEGKYRVVSNSLSEAFGGTPHAQNGIKLDLTSLQAVQAILPSDQVNSMIAQELPDHRLLSAAASTTKATTRAGSQLVETAAAAAPAASAQGPAGTQGSGNPADMQEQRELASVTDDVTTALQTLIAAGQVHVRRYGSWIAVDISTDILFGSGVAHLSQPAVTALDRLAAALAPWPMPCASRDIRMTAPSARRNIRPTGSCLRRGPPASCICSWTMASLLTDWRYSASVSTVRPRQTPLRAGAMPIGASRS